MKHQTVFLLSPPNMGLYKDIEKGLVDLGYKVECITKSIQRDPFSVISLRSQLLYSKSSYLKRLEDMWLEIYNSGNYTFNYDFLLVINGAFVHPILFDLLHKKNPKIIKVCYLYDTTKVYHYERNFTYFDRIYSFDRLDVEKFNLHFLPIYWVPNENRKNEIDIFGFGSYKKDRYLLFQKIEELSINLGLKSFIKVYDSSSGLNWKGKIRRFFKLLLIYNKYDRSLVSNVTIPPSDFRRMIASSRIILDTKLIEQDGLTARFMWALGAGKKIITNNQSAKDYPFYSKEQICIVNKKAIIPDDFLVGDYVMSDATRSIVDSYRIDNWLKQMLEN